MEYFRSPFMLIWQPQVGFALIGCLACHLEKVHILRSQDPVLQNLRLFTVFLLHIFTVLFTVFTVK